MNKLLFASVIVLFTACKEISYKEPQPQGKRALHEIPQELRGKYLLVDDDGTTEDTLIVTNNGYSLVNDSTKGVLSDSLVLKKYKGFYFFNDNENPEWILRVVKREVNGDLSYMAMDSGEKSFNEFLFDLNKEIKIDSIEVKGEKLYQIDPSPKQLILLIKNGYFKTSLRLKKLK